MPPQQANRPLDVIDEGLNFRAHERLLGGSKPRLTGGNGFSDAGSAPQPVN
jgi:hypothetical protein